MTRRTPVLSIVLASLAALGMLVLVAPDYLSTQGFPLDDAWIHAVYGREVARSGSLAYNPGVPATGSTSPLWSVTLALPYLVGSPVGGAVLLTKLLGFGLHVLTALVLYAALAGASAFGAMRLAGVLLVACFPDLLSASVSGMETPLATLTAVGLLYAAPRAGVVAYAALSALAVAARPELAIVSASLPFIMLIRGERRFVPMVASALVGSAVAFGLFAARNLAVSGLPLPATFYAKVGTGGFGFAEGIRVGFTELLGQLPVTDSSLLLVGLVGLSALVLWSKEATPGLTIAATSFLSGLLFCAVSFVLIPPIDPGAFYHQRYILPAIPLIVGPIPVLVDVAMTRWLPLSYRRLGRVTLLAFLAASLLIDAPIRYQRLANDARNIDQVQVALGRSLASASASDVVLAIDAGAIRYFGNAFVVDLLGLNTPQMLGAQGQEFLDSHPPRYIEIVPLWSRLDEQSDRQLQALSFEPATPYTVTGFPAMGKHWLVQCDHGSVSGELAVRSRSFRFTCAASQAAG